MYVNLHPTTVNWPAYLDPDFGGLRGNVQEGMAAGGSRINSNRRGAMSGRGAMIRREDQAPLPSQDPYVQAIDSLEEISEWLGTFRERLRAAHAHELPEVAKVVHELEARYQMRRAELS
jgi:hypothetical protein